MKTIVIALAFFSLISCVMISQKNVLDGRKIVSENISIGDNIFEAKNKLKNAGLAIKYGPADPTHTNSYYLMIVDYGASANRLEILRDGIGKSNKKIGISGIIEADVSGRIYKIE